MFKQKLQIINNKKKNDFDLEKFIFEFWLFIG